MRVLSKAFGRLKLTLPWVPPDTKVCSFHKNYEWIKWRRAYECFFAPPTPRHITGPVDKDKEFLFLFLTPICNFLTLLYRGGGQNRVSRPRV